MFGHLAIHLVAKLKAPKLLSILLEYQNLVDFSKRILKQLYDYDTDCIVPPAPASDPASATSSEYSALKKGLAKYGVVAGFITLIAVGYVSSTNSSP